MRAPCLLPIVIAGASALAQSRFPAVFVANNGNLEGSVSSFRVEGDARVTLVQKLILGDRLSSEPNDPGTNAYAISITPSGRFLAISHATGATVSEQISVVEVAPDATLTLFQAFQTPDSPLKLQFLRDDLLAVTRTQSSGTNSVILYRFDPNARTLNRIDSVDTGGFTSDLAASPDGRFVLCNDSPLSGAASIRAFEIVADRLVPRGVAFAPGTYAIGMGLTPEGNRVYTCGGSRTPYIVHAFDLDGAGDFLPLAASPFPSGGTSPKQGVVSPDGAYLFVGHGTDGSIHTHAIDAAGALTHLGLAFDVGIQGSLGDMACARVDGRNLLFFTDRETYDSTPRGLFSAEINADGSLRIISTRVDSLGVAPNDIVVWAIPTPCDADLDDGTGTGTRDGAVTIDDLLYFLGMYEGGDVRADLDDGSGTGTRDQAVTIDDLLFFLAHYEGGC